MILINENEFPYSSIKKGTLESILTIQLGHLKGLISYNDSLLTLEFILNPIGENKYSRETINKVKELFINIEEFKRW